MINKKKIKQLDSAGVYSSIKQLPDQIGQVMQEVRKISFPQRYHTPELIAISGMGGSIYSYYVLISLSAGQLTKPVVGINDYHLPRYVGKNALFIGSSYSGTTEETLATTQKAIEKNCIVTALTTGGKLAEMMKKHKLPFYQFKPLFNRCGQPRVGVGYMIFGAMFLLDKLGFLSINQTQLRKSLSILKTHDQMLQEKAAILKAQLKDTVIIFTAAEHLNGLTHAARNQINESAKAFAEYHPIPELNHHLMEGLTYPKNQKLLFVFYHSPFYEERNKKRFEVTKKVLKKQGIHYIDISFEASNKMEEFLFYLQFSSYLSLFLGIDYGVDPAPIPWVDYFKAELAK